MTHFIQLLLPYLLLYKYWAIFSITFFAALILPIPPGTLLMASSAFASQGFLSFGWVVVAGILGNIAGDNVGYFLARKYGKSALRKIGFGKILENQKYANFEKKIRKSPGALIFFSRFEVFSNLAVNLISGLGRVPYGKYLFYESIGEIFQVALYCYIGYLVGDNWEEISAIIGRFLLLVVFIIVVIVIIFRKRIWKSITKDV